ncbi:crotonobetainyl-CoA:carnitine CoA-transferase CaiB-like acyl-CoA transferase [Actinocorallia herbida]|uniref:Crotonobetainyl-CoA:carnitine CoA-transferase CaiB-like acyl-CoA transferase n=1 Tax=Actinocorallia herbida TaxID=58109 RepID=A0A3N1D351_9ACTN|nr:CoA transferase [Actinocorallia herbida]ROO87964.1 crotonobetainyl-CoA:carnitine CoA-transferase CaiB-like acyl-CoA transferase [Actinocorallia herbida]
MAVSAFSQEGSSLPLAGVRVVDMAEGKAEMCGRYLADLGAEVIRVEPPGGAASRFREPVVNGVSLYFATRNAGKRGIVLDLEKVDDRARLLRLLETADIFLETERPGALDELGLGARTLRESLPSLVVVSISDFGQTGPYRDWVATNWTHLAMGGVLSRSGMPGRPPLMPPGGLAYESAAVQAAWAALLAYTNRLDTGRGDHVDCSVYEMTAQSLDPGFGIGGSATGGRPPYEGPRGRPRPGLLYPIFPCADGHVRICLLSKRQWRGMFGWLGEPAEFADPEFDKLHVRFKAAERLYGLIGRFFAERGKEELLADGQRLGVPIAALLTPADVLQSEHFLARGGLADAEIAPGLRGRVPTGYAEINGVRAGFRHRAPSVGEHTAEVLTGEAPADEASSASAWIPAGTERRRPLEGLRVLDLGVIVVGAELGRLFADQGAEVIKVENKAFPDGSRQSTSGAEISPSFAWGHRNKVSLGLNLRSSEGVELFKRLVAESDVVLSNFKPGTLESLGLGYEVLKQVNPRLVMADSSALGSSGPWSRRMGYGPLVRASAGLTGLWRDLGVDNGFCDGVTIYPDHIAGRVGAVAVLALLIARRRSDRGGTVSVSQAETILTQMSDDFLRESLEPGSFRPRGNTGEWDAPQGVYACAGDDEWCAVTVRDDADWRALCSAIERPDLLEDVRLAGSAGRVAHRALVDEALGSWTAARPPRAVMTGLQAAGVPAGMMQRVVEYLDDPQLRARDFFRELDQPGLAAPLPTENAPATFQGLADPELRPAPRMGEHTREVCAKVLGLSDAEIESLLASGVLEEPA